MKRITPFALLLIMFLSTMGYYAVFLGLQYHNDRTMTKVLESGVFDSEKILTLKVAISIPYMQDQVDFDNVDGKFEHNGKMYRMAKQRYAKDTLTIVCVRDTEHEKINTALEDYVIKFSDHASDTKSTSKIVINFTKDYLPIYFKIGSATSGWVSGVVHSSPYGDLIPAFSSSIVHPPERA